MAYNDESAMKNEPKRAKVGEVVRELDSSSDETIVYFNKLTGEFILVSDEDERLVESDYDDEDVPDWQKDYLPKVREALESDECIALPDRFEIHEWAIMRDFSVSVSEQRVSEGLFEALRGKGAFRRFHSQVRAFGVENDWYQFRENAFQRIAIRWLEENDIPYDVDEGDA